MSQAIKNDEKQILISVKLSADAKPAKQMQNSIHDALNLMIRAISGLGSMDETSASLLALKYMDEITSGKTAAKGIENTKNGHVIVFQLAA